MPQAYDWRFYVMQICSISNINCFGSRRVYAKSISFYGKHWTIGSTKNTNSSSRVGRCGNVIAWLIHAGGQPRAIGVQELCTLIELLHDHDWSFITFEAFISGHLQQLTVGVSPINGHVTMFFGLGICVTLKLGFLVHTWRACWNSPFFPPMCCMLAETVPFCADKSIVANAPFPLSCWYIACLLKLSLFLIEYGVLAQTPFSSFHAHMEANWCSPCQPSFTPGGITRHGHTHFSSNLWAINAMLSHLIVCKRGFNWQQICLFYGALSEQE